MVMEDVNRSYVARWFWSLEGLAEAVGISADEVLELIGAACAPGPIYVLDPRGRWWSALSGERPAPTGEAWYSPGAAWGLRRAVAMMRSGVTATEAAVALRRDFVRQFLITLPLVAGSSAAFPTCFKGGSLNEAVATATANGEWGDWLDGGYGVCLRVFTAATCITKETLGHAIKGALAEKTEAVSLLGDAEALSAIMLPFAPWQRADGTPGKTIDTLLRATRLGDDRPYATMS